ncbi:hypothetical protein NM688_g4214 [Phlebia brevispora]|uniref:Uncharacterized protein n=1 Tax=Phlebia brevispora TaxID=194682 RepID=A0ACC1T3R7_9APHY|nr:hypothetical protein NM688_g4214 [Phlebia brevispora]
MLERKCVSRSRAARPIARHIRDVLCAAVCHRWLPRLSKVFPAQSSPTPRQIRAVQVPTSVRKHTGLQRYRVIGSPSTVDGGGDGKVPNGAGNGNSHAIGSIGDDAWSIGANDKLAAMVASSATIALTASAFSFQVNSAKTKQGFRPRLLRYLLRKGAKEQCQRCRCRVQPKVFNSALVQQNIRHTLSSANMFTDEDLKSRITATVYQSLLDRIAQIYTTAEDYALEAAAPDARSFDRSKRVHGLTGSYSGDFTWLILISYIVTERLSAPRSALSQAGAHGIIFRFFSGALVGF